MPLPLVIAAAGLAVECAFCIATGRKLGLAQNLLAISASALVWTTCIFGLRRFRAALAVLLFPIAYFYGLSWAYRGWVGRFISVNDLRLLAANIDAGLWATLSTAEKAIVAGYSLAFVVAFVLVARALRDASLGKQWTRRLLIVWLASAASFAALRLALTLAGGDPDADANPLTALIATAAPAIEPSATAIPAAELVPRSKERPLPPAARKPAIVILEIESLRADVLGVMPNLQKLADQGLLFTHAWATSTHTSYGEPAIAASLWPLRHAGPSSYRADDPYPKTLIYDLLKPQGYATALFSSSQLAWWGLDAFFRSPSLDVFFDAGTSGKRFAVDPRDIGAYDAIKTGRFTTGSLPDPLTVERASQWMRAQQKPFFLYLGFQDSHFPYVLPPLVPRPYQPAGVPDSASFLKYAPEAAPAIRNAYFNALHEIDRLIGGLLADVGPDAIVAVVGDHGESFGEHGIVTHGNMPSEEQARTTLILKGPPDLVPPGRSDYPVSTLDVAPTLLSRLGLPPWPGFQGIDVLAKDRPPAFQRLVFMHANAIAPTSAIVWGGRWKYMTDLRGGAKFLFDLRADPGEERNLVDSNAAVRAVLEDLLDRWTVEQLSYYAFPSYYQKYLPPQGPAVDGRLQALFME